MASTPSTERSRPVTARLAAAVLCWLCSPGVGFSQTSYIPATIGLVNLNSGAVCAVGYTNAGSGSNYYLTQSGSTGTWTQLATAQSISAYTVGSQITGIQTSPGPITRHS
jgi:hypothetical protein